MSPKKATIFFLLASFFCGSLPSLFGAATGEKAMVVTPDPRATQAALEVLNEGGNALDAAIAAQWVFSVVQPQSSGVGGSGQLLFYDAAMRRILFFDGNVRAPGESNRGMFLDEKGELPPYRPDRNTGGRPVGVPGLLKLLQEVHSQFGTRKFPFEKLFDPAIKQAEEGTEVSEVLAQALRDEAPRLALSEEARKDLFDENGQPLREGQKLLQPDLAKMFRLVQTKGLKAFYDGDIAKAMVRAVQKDPFRPGSLSYRDLKHYEVVRRNPVHGSYQGYDLFSFSAPSSGGVMLLRGLNLLAHFDAAGLGKTTDIFHLLEEVQKIAFTNRMAIADPDLFDVPEKELLSQEWAQARAESIKFEKVLKDGRASRNPPPEDMKKPTRSSILVADAQGNRVALCATLGDAFGAAVKVPGYGFFLNNQLTDFDMDPASVNDPDATNVVSPEQRPRNAAAPLLIFKEGRFVLALDAYGPEEPAAILLNLLVLNLDLGVTCEGTLAAPRLVDADGVMRIEPELYDDGLLRTRLELLGQKLEKTENLGRAQAICSEDGSGKMTGASDPRGSGDAAGI